jgi:hypothetical protein
MLALTQGECKAGGSGTHPLALRARTLTVMTTTRRDAARQGLALASAGAGAIHLALGPEHMSEWAVLGTSFYVSGALQLLWAVRLVTSESRRLLAVGAFGSALFIGVWLVSRTTGLPIGPEAFAPEAVGRADLICIALEAAVTVGALTLLRRPAAGRAPAGRLAVRGVLATVALAVLATTGVAVAAPGHEHGGAACPTSPVASGVDANHNGADDGVEAYFACQLLHEHDHHKGYVSPKL